MSSFFDTAYEGCPPWDLGRPQPAVVELAPEIVGSVLDLGCGTGEHALYLAERGHEVLGIDLAPRAIEIARAKARERNLEARFLVWDALRAHELGRAFDTALDVGLFHTLRDEERERYARSLRDALPPGGRAFILCWSERNPPGLGPRRVTRIELRSTFTAAGLRVEAIRPARLESRLEIGMAHAWLARLRRS